MASTADSNEPAGERTISDICGTHRFLTIPTLNLLILVNTPRIRRVSECRLLLRDQQKVVSRFREAKGDTVPAPHYRVFVGFRTRKNCGPFRILRAS
jgi:hypothetical protein